MDLRLKTLFCVGHLSDNVSAYSLGGVLTRQFTCLSNVGFFHLTKLQMNVIYKNDIIPNLLVINIFKILRIVKCNQYIIQANNFSYTDSVFGNKTHSFWSLQ